MSTDREREGDEQEADAYVGILSEGMRVEVYNATGTLRVRSTIDRPTRMTLLPIDGDRNAH